MGKSWLGRVAASSAGAYLGWQLWRRLRAPELTGKVVLITGGSRGLGLELARRFAAAGCRIIICARDEQELERARLDIERRGAEVLARRCDVADWDQVRELITAAMERFGAIDVVVNNAGIIQVGPAESMTVSDFARAMAVNFWGPFNIITAVLPHMRGRREGRIVNITSIGGKVAVPHLLPYDCAKAAFVSLSEGLCAELAKDGIRVTTVVPGLMRTGSPVNAFFKGNAEREFEWFTLGDSRRLTSMSADRAAQKIVEATRRGDREVVLSVQAKLLRLVHGVLPGVVVRALAFVNRRLPADNSGERFHATRGMQLATDLVPSERTRDMNTAARRLNQYGGKAKPSAAHVRGLIR